MYLTRKNMMAILDTLLGGRAAEELVFGKEQITSGCGDDLNKATSLALQAVLTGVLDHKSLAVFDYSKLSEKRKFEVDQKVQATMASSLERAKAVLNKNKALLTSLAKRLMERDTLSVEEVTELMGSLNTSSKKN